MTMTVVVYDGSACLTACRIGEIRGSDDSQKELCFAGSRLVKAMVW